MNTSSAARVSQSTRSPSWNGQGQVVPAGKHAEYYPILFIEPSEKNQWMLGFDIESNPKYRAAIGGRQPRGNRLLAPA